MDLGARDFGGITSDNVRGRICGFRCICMGESSFRPVGRIHSQSGQFLDRFLETLCQSKCGRFVRRALAVTEDKIWALWSAPRHLHQKSCLWQFLPTALLKSDCQDCPYPSGYWCCRTPCVCLEMASFPWSVNVVAENIANAVVSVKAARKHACLMLELE